MLCTFYSNIETSHTNMHTPQQAHYCSRIFSVNKKLCSLLVRGCRHSGLCRHIVVHGHFVFLWSICIDDPTFSVTQSPLHTCRVEGGWNFGLCWCGSLATPHSANTVTPHTRVWRKRNHYFFIINMLTNWHDYYPIRTITMVYNI